MACKHCEISTFIKDNGIDLLFVTEIWLTANCHRAKTFEIAPIGFDVKSSHVNCDRVVVELQKYSNLT